MTRDDPAAFAPPPAFGPFRVLHQVGIGALGPVFRTYEPTRDRLVAVKLFRLDITPEQAQSLADELRRACEAGLFHPSIVEPIAAGVEGTAAYRAEEYVAAESLDVAIRHYAPAPLDKALPFITQLAGAIDFARAAGVGHGGLHLRDVFVTPEEARASGFGIVESLERVGIRAPVRRPYSAPERIAGSAWSTPADVFSLAAISYELLTGRRPSGTGAQIGGLAAATLGEHEPAVQGVLARAMDEDPERRYTTAAAFVAALHAAAQGRAAETSSPPPAASAAPAAAGMFAEEQPREPDIDAAPERGPALEPPDASVVAPVMIEVPSLAADAFAEEEEEEEEETRQEVQQEEAPVPTTATAAPVLLVDHADTLRPSGTEQASTLFDAHEGAPAIDDGIGDRPIGVQEAPRWQYDSPELPASRDLFQPLVEPQRSRSIIGPVAIGFLLGAAAGLAGGYALATAGRPEAVQTSHVASPSSAPSTPAPPSQPQGAGRAWSERSVAQPPAAPPPVPQDGAARSDARTARATRGSITVESTPKNAAVTVNGKWQGRTPVTIDDLAFGRHTVRIVQPGYTVALQTVTLSKEQPSRTLTFQLQRPASAAKASPSVQSNATRSAAAAQSGSAGSLFVASNPAGARVFVDGRDFGTAPLRIPELPVGPHVIRLELPDHRIWTTSERVVAGQEKRVTGSLERIQ